MVQVAELDLDGHRICVLRRYRHNPVGPLLTNQERVATQYPWSLRKSEEFPNSQRGGQFYHRHGYCYHAHEDSMGSSNAAK